MFVFAVILPDDNYANSKNQLENTELKCKDDKTICLNDLENDLPTKLWNYPVTYLVTLAHMLIMVTISSFYSFIFVCFGEFGWKHEDVSMILLIIGKVPLFLE